MQMYFFVIAAFILIQNFNAALSSNGDRSPFYQNCVKNCLKSNCTLDDSKQFNAKGALLQDPWSRRLKWSCVDECRYHCMWRTVDSFEDRGYKLPKFHGKWPFTRILGVQEPASAFASLLNLVAHAYMFSKLLTDKRFPMKHTPMLLFWYIFILVCMNAWIWSAIFHTRDTPLTEFMDYACALSMVAALLVAAIVRVLYNHKLLATITLCIPAVYFVKHIQYLHSGNVDYEYNMSVNVCFGLVGSSVWLGWSLVHWYRSGSRYVWRMVLFNKLSGAALLLELFDFPPLGNAWDAHALWHLTTAPLPLIFYSFVLEDLEHLQISKMSQKIDLKLA